jgi:hypothetical protein
MGKNDVRERGRDPFLPARAAIAGETFDSGSIRAGVGVVSTTDDGVSAYCGE